MKHRRRSVTEHEPAKVYGYCRVSTDAQAQQGHSLGEQQSRIKGYAQSAGLTVHQMFVEAGVSGGKKFELRPKGAALLAALRPGDHVIATKLDRMFRNAGNAIAIAERLRDNGVHLHLLDIGEVTGTGVAKLLFQILGSVAEMERDRISERVRGVKEHLRSSGFFLGGTVAKGFTVDRDGRLVQDAKWQKCVAAMKRMREEEVPYRTIATRVGSEFGVALDYTTAYRILNGKRSVDSVRVA